MAKNKHSDQSRSHYDNRSRQDSSRLNTILLILAILFFLFGLLMLARANGFSFTDAWNSLFRATPASTGTGTNQPGINGRPGTGGSSGAAGSGGTGADGSDNGTGADDTSSGQNVNVNSDAGINVDAGVDEGGNLYVKPTINLNPEGGTGAEGSVNDNKIIDL